MGVFHVLKLIKWYQIAQNISYYDSKLLYQNMMESFCKNYFSIKASWQMLGMVLNVSVYHV